MSEQSSEPDKYSLDDMMQRLKGRDEENSQKGELVTRSDGSLAMKVKKRRRRTDQTRETETKRNQKVQILQIAGFVVFVAVIGLIAGIGIIYANSSPFRDGLIAKVESASGAKVELKRFRINPATANSNLVGFEWPSGNALASLQLRGLVGKIAPVSFLGKAFTGEEITVSSGELIMRKPAVGEPARISATPFTKPPVHFERYFIAMLDVYFGGEKIPSSMLEKTEVSLFPGARAGNAELRLNGGLLKMQDWSPFSLDRSYITFSGDELDVKSLRFEIPTATGKKSSDPGYIELSGVLQPLDPREAHMLSVELNSFKVSYLLGADLGGFFSGRLETKENTESNVFTVPAKSGEPASLKLSTINQLGSRLELRGFQFLEDLSNILEDRWYENPNFGDHVSMKFLRKGNFTSIKDFEFEERGRMAVRGTISNGEAGQIEGRIRVGIPEAIIVTQRSPSLEAAFDQSAKGYRWIDIEIGGTSAVPTDNFLDLFGTARTGSEMLEDQSSEVDSFESLINGE